VTHPDAIAATLAAQRPSLASAALGRRGRHKEGTPADLAADRRLLRRLRARTQEKSTAAPDRRRARRAGAAECDHVGLYAATPYRSRHDVQPSRDRRIGRARHIGRWSLLATRPYCR